MTSESLMMINLSKDDEQLIQRLARPFAIEAIPIRNHGLKAHEVLQKQMNTCLLILRVEQDRYRQVQIIRRLKGVLCHPVPLLVLVPYDLLSNIHQYIKAGADDYIIIPLDEESFAIRFYVLLECGQAIIQTRQKSASNPYAPKNETWRRVVGYLQEGLSFFSPKSQFARSGRRPIFSKWQPINKIATGGDGEIWLVREVGNEREAIAKIPHNPELNISTLRAAAVLKRLVYHPNIIHLIEVVKDGDKYILIQEYVNGVTLPERIEKGISSKDKENLFLQLMAVSAYAHDHRIMHRDIKPDNIMVKPNGLLKLLDFGSARDVTWINEGASGQGTLNFMPPEQFEGKPCLASDVWALGCILYILTVNRLPFYQDNRIYPMDIDINRPAVPPRTLDSSLSKALEQVIMRCFEINLEKRYRDASALRKDLLAKIPNFGNGNTLPSEGV